MAIFTKDLSWFCLLLMCGCSGMQQSEQEKLRRQNAQGEFIHRNSNEYRYAIADLKQKKRAPYPWEKGSLSHHTKITKEFFRCRGSSSHPPHANHKDPTQAANFFDCGGAQKHSLPLREDKEYVFPILVDLLNYIQEKTGCKVVITCGHRCPVHNAYADSSTYNQNSKHMIGAEVDFYVQGLELQPEKVLAVIMGFYRENGIYRGDKQYLEFQRLENVDLNVSTPPWMNKEILVKLYKKHEGRDFDNRHPYPYLSIQVRYDRDLNEKVLCSWQKAFNCFKRY